MFGIDDIGGAAIGLGTSFIGGLMQNQQNEAAANRNMAFQDQQAKQQMAFQERMSNTSFQRSRKDMEAAGFNPMLAFEHGGASTPSGASGGGASYHAENILQQGVSNAMEYSRMKKDLAETQSRIDLNEKQGKLTEQETNKKKKENKILDPAVVVADLEEERNKKHPSLALFFKKIGEIFGKQKLVP